MRALVLFAVLLTGCQTVGEAVDPATVEGTDSLVLFLEDRGFVLEPAGLTSSTSPLAVATTYKVSNLPTPALLEVFEFEDEAAALEGLQLLRAELRVIAGQTLYADGPLVVYRRGERYLGGASARLDSALSSALGPPRDA